MITVPTFNDNIDATNNIAAANTTIATATTVVAKKLFLNPHPHKNQMTVPLVDFVSRKEMIVGFCQPESGEMHRILRIDGPSCLHESHDQPSGIIPGCSTLNAV